MEHRIDPLIADRAPWLFSERPGAEFARRMLNRVLGYRETLALAATLDRLDAPGIMRLMAGRIARRVTVQGLQHVPATGPALVIANHPTGIADGIILHDILCRVRPDIYFFANNDILKVLPQMAAVIAPVEWRPERRSHGRTRDTLAYTRRAVDKGRLGVIFPSGRLAKRRGLRLVERDWMTSAASLARRHDLPIVPVHIDARNSWLFYAFDAIHPTLRDITLFHETLNKDRQRFDVRIGPAISPAALPRDNDLATQDLRRAVLGLGRRADTTPGASPEGRKVPI